MTANKKIVFVIEDDTETLEMISLILRDSFTFYTFTDVTLQFFDLLNKITPDFVLFDYLVPSGKVPQAINAVKNLYKDRTKIILMSALKQSKIPLIPGVDHFLAKPFIVVDLKEALMVKNEDKSRGNIFKSLFE